VNKCFVVKDGVDVQVLGTKNNVVSIGAKRAIDFAIHAMSSLTSCTQPQKEHSQNLSLWPLLWVWLYYNKPPVTTDQAIRVLLR
jgi:sRNA-binding carbon storage regulator CsrA